MLNPIALRKTKSIYNFGLSYSNKVNLKIMIHLNIETFEAHIQFLAAKINFTFFSFDNLGSVVQS